MNPRGYESVNPPGDIKLDHNLLFSSDDDDKMEMVEVGTGIVDVDARGHSSLQQYLQQQQCQMCYISHKVHSLPITAQSTFVPAKLCPHVYCYKALSEYKIHLDGILRCLACRHPASDIIHHDGRSNIGNGGTIDIDAGGHSNLLAAKPRPYVLYMSRASLPT